MERCSLLLHFPFVRVEKASRVGELLIKEMRACAAAGDVVMAESKVL